MCRREQAGSGMSSTKKNTTSPAAVFEMCRPAHRYYRKPYGTRPWWAWRPKAGK